MPCSAHASGSNESCVACLAADLLSFDVKVKEKSKTLKFDLKALVKRYKALAPKGEDGENCRCALGYINSVLGASDLDLILGDGGGVELGQIQAGHRVLYRQRLRRMGTWIGFTELHRLAVAFGVRFSIAVPSGNRWRLVQVGPEDATLIPRLVLRWTGAHYEVASLGQRHGAEYDIGAVFTTNPRGDCAVESFLILLDLCDGIVQRRWFFLTDEMRSVLRRFRNASQLRPEDGLIPHGDDHYIAAIEGCRAVLESGMSNDDVNQAIIAEGVLPSEEKKSEKSSGTGSSIAPQALLEQLDDKFGELLATHAVEAGNPGDVVCIFFDGRGGPSQRVAIQAAESDDHGFALANCSHDQKKECEHSVSDEDAEVLLLSAALDTVLSSKNDLIQIMLCGPYGPCNGCKDRIQRFVTLWQKDAPKKQRLVVYYLYANVDHRTRGKTRIQTVYGDDNDPYSKVVVKGKKVTLYLHTWGPVTGNKG